MSRDSSKYGGRISVTEILSAVNLSNFDGIDPRVVAAAADRGQEVHEWATIVDAGVEVPHDDIDPRVSGCIRAYESFLAEVEPKLLASERVVINEEWEYAGTLDRVFKMKRRYEDGTEKNVKVVVDLKCPVKASKSWRLQTAGYAMAYGRKKVKEFDRATLQIMPNKQYKLLYWDNGADYNTFLAAVRVARFMGEV